MIAKHVQSKKGNYRRLVSYLLHPQDKQERVGQVSVSNCQSDDPGVAVLEVLNTQAQNTRTGANKTYHLLFSFRAGEHVTEETLRAIEERLCAGLGYGEHQRISVVHHDTDNLHVHVAINKIHPTRHTIHTPFNDYRTLGRLCSQLEREFNLERDNHQAGKRSDENAADDMEHHAGVESLLGWIRRTCRQELCTARSWKELQNTLKANGLELRQRGNGFVLVDDSGCAVKASSVDRLLAKERLEARLGPLEGQDGTDAQTKRTYSRAPIKQGKETAALYARYQAERAQAVSQLASQYQNLRDRRRRMIEVVKRRARLKRSAIRLMRGDRITKRVLYSLVSRALLAQIKEIHERCNKQRRAVGMRYSKAGWVDWLCAKAQQGDGAALEALRARRANEPKDGNALHGEHDAAASSTDGCDGITRKGSVIYRYGKTVLRDTGTRLEVSATFDAGGLHKAIELTVARFGNCIHVEGSDAFRDQIARVAAGMDVRFDDANLERRRKQMAAQKGEHHETEGGSQGPAAGRGVPGDRAGAGPTVQGQSEPGNVGTRPPPAARHRLRKLSELGMVRVAGGGKVLLPGDVPGDLEQQGAATAHGVRRPVSELSADKAASAAAEKYVFEREQTRCRFSDISKHRTYDGFEGAALFGGLRKVDGVVLALLQVGEEVLVKPVDAKTASGLKRLRIGAPLAVSADGAIRAKGRSR